MAPALRRREKHLAIETARKAEVPGASLQSQGHNGVPDHCVVVLEALSWFPGITFLENQRGALDCGHGQQAKTRGRVAQSEASLQVEDLVVNRKTVRCASPRMDNGAGHRSNTRGRRRCPPWTGTVDVDRVILNCDPIRRADGSEAGVSAPNRHFLKQRPAIQRRRRLVIDYDQGQSAELPHREGACVARREQLPSGLDGSAVRPLRSQPVEPPLEDAEHNPRAPQLVGAKTQACALVIRRSHRQPKLCGQIEVLPLEHANHTHRAPRRTRPSDGSCGDHLPHDLRITAPVHLEDTDLVRPPLPFLALAGALEVVRKGQGHLWLGSGNWSRRLPLRRPLQYRRHSEKGADSHLERKTSDRAVDVRQPLEQRRCGTILAILLEVRIPDCEL
mmetsp:Transcript_100821/g.291520  ORF Transcript_100821/g.291520 Transcript_100821/m.291520 type:complete len:390 (+) Transcript_100821:306-1475(+)